MEQPFSLLSTTKAPLFLRVVAHPLAPSRGVVKLKVRRLSQSRYRDLKNALLVAQKQGEVVEKESNKEPFTMQKEEALDLARDVIRQAKAALICAMVEDHDPAAFAFVVPVFEEGTSAYQELMGIACSMGYTEAEAHTGITTDGRILKQFERYETGDASFRMYEFYRCCQDREVFSDALLVALMRLMDGVVRSPKQQWLAAGVPLGDIPQDF